MSYRNVTGLHPFNPEYRSYATSILSKQREASRENEQVLSYTRDRLARAQQELAALRQAVNHAAPASVLPPSKRESKLLRRIENSTIGIEERVAKGNKILHTISVAESRLNCWLNEAMNRREAKRAAMVEEGVEWTAREMTLWNENEATWRSLGIELYPDLWRKKPENAGDYKGGKGRERGARGSRDGPIVGKGPTALTVQRVQEWLDGLSCNAEESGPEEARDDEGEEGTDNEPEGQDGGEDEGEDEDEDDVEIETGSEAATVYVRPIETKARAHSW